MNLVPRLVLVSIWLLVPLRAQDEWSKIAADAARLTDPLEKIRRLQTIVSPEPIVIGTERAEMLGRYRFELGEAAEAALDAARQSGRADHFAGLAVAAYGQAIILGGKAGDAFCRQVAISAEGSENWSAVRTSLFGAITQASALVWRSQIVGMLTGEKVCERPPTPGAIPAAGLQTLFGGILLTYAAVPVSITNFYCDEWPVLTNIAVKHVKLTVAIHELDAAYNFGSCEAQSRTPFGVPFDSRSAAPLERYVDDRGTVSLILERLGDDFVQTGGQSIPGAGTWTYGEFAALERYRAAWSIDSENTGSALNTADLLAKHSKETIDSQKAGGEKFLVESTRRSLLNTYAFPSGLPRTSRWIGRLVQKNVDRTFDQYTREDLDNLISMYATLKSVEPEIKTPARLENQVRSVKQAPNGQQFPVLYDGSKVLRGYLGNVTLESCQTASDPRVEMVRGELHTFWPPALNVSAAAVSPANSKEFSMRFRRRFVAGQYLSIRDFRTGCSIPCPQCAVGESWLHIPVHQRRPSWSPVYDGGPLRMYLKLGGSLFVNGGQTHIHLAAGVTADVNLHIWYPGILRPDPAREEQYAPPGKDDHRRVTTLLQWFAGFETDPLHATVQRQAGGREDLALEQASGSLTLATGVYAPFFRNRLLKESQFWNFGLFNKDERPYAVFAAPIAKGGVEMMTVPCCDKVLSASHSRFWAAGGRIGLLRFVPAEQHVSPALLSYFDVTAGRWDRFRRLDSRTPTRVELAASAALPWNLRLFTAGFNANLGPGGSEVRIVLGFRFDAGWSISKLARLPQQ